MDQQALNVGLQKCTHVELARRDVSTALSTYVDLRPTVDSFVFNDGSNRDLLALDGTIPVSYKGSTYNIPVCLWLVEAHPYNAPMVYVKPTSSMQIRPGRYVDSNGKVNLPYLRDWRYPNSTLYGLLQVLAVVFGEEMPVFAKSAAPPRPPYPPTGHVGGQLPYPPASGVSQPPYPVAGGGFPMPMPNMTASTGYTPYPSTSQPGSYPRQQFTYPQYPPTPGYTPTSSASYPHGNPPASGYPPITTAATQNSSQPSAALSNEAIRASVLSCVEDKMRRKLQERFMQHNAEYEALKRTHDDLSRGQAKLEEMINKLKEEQDKAVICITTLDDKNSELNQLISRQEAQKDVSVEDAVDTTAPLYRQLVKLFAEEQAIEDAIYYLGKALGNGVIDLEVFLKKVRELSRKQFTLRALINKCRQKAGLS